MSHPWPMFPPETNYYSMVSGAGPSPMLAYGDALLAHAATMTSVVGVSSATAVGTSAAFVGAGGTASEAAVVAHNSEHSVFADETLARAQIAHLAAATHSATVTQMVPAPPAHANRLEEAADELINPLVWGALTPRIVDLNTEYFGFMWPNNAAAGVRYGVALDGFGAALLTPSLPAISGGSVAAVAVAAATVAESAALSGMQAAVGMVSSGASAVASPAAALPAAAMSAVSSSGSSVASPAGSAPVQPLAAVTHSAPPTPAQTLAPAQSSAGMFAPAPTANLMTPPPVPPTAQPPMAQPLTPRPPIPAAMPAAPGVTSFVPPAQPFSPPPPTAGRAAGLKPGMLNAAALRGPVSTMPLTTTATSTLATATQPLAYVPPQPPLPPAPPTPPQPPLLNPGQTAHTLNPPPQPQQSPPPPHTPPQPPEQQPQSQSPTQAEPQPQPNPSVGATPNQGVHNLIGDLKDSPGAQALSVHNNADVHNIVDPLPPGENKGVHVLPTPQQIGDLYNQLTENATPLPPGTYGKGLGKWALLPDGTRIGYRPNSEWGGPTVEIWDPGDPKPKTSVHLPERSTPTPQPAPEPAPQPHPVQVPATQTPAPQTPAPADDHSGHPSIHVDPPPPGVWATIVGILGVIGGIIGGIGEFTR